jgi:hypothetical protein
VHVRLLQMQSMTPRSKCACKMRRMLLQAHVRWHGGSKSEWVSEACLQAELNPARAVHQKSAKQAARLFRTLPSTAAATHV